MIPLRDSVPTRKFPLFNWFFLISNTIIFIYELIIPDPQLRNLFYQAGFVPKLFFENPLPRFHTVITSAFLHGGWLHFLGNMLYLYIFGDNVEDMLGYFYYPLFYIGGAVVASLFQSIFSQGDVPMIGASGAIAGVLGFYLVFFPRARVLTLIPLWFFWEIIPIPALIFLGFWFYLQFISGVFSIGASAGVAFFAHIGGFLYGAGVAYVIKKKKKRKFYY